MELVKVYNAKDDLEAGIIADILKNNYIPCHIQDAGAGEYLNIYYGFTIYGKDIYVNKSQFNDAKALIDEINSSEAGSNYSTFDNNDEYNSETNINGTDTIPCYYKKERLVRSMFLIPIILAIFFTLLGIIEKV